jgi:lipoprotein-releasing system ATP-binding protein
MNEPVLQARGIEKRFEIPGQALNVLRGVDLDIFEGEIVAIQGASGVGKSTLLHILGTLDPPTAGDLICGEGPLLGRGDAELAQFRNRYIGFVFQFHHLMPEFTALENVMMPGLIGRQPARDSRERARELLAAVGLGEREQHKPQELSGGEQQRVAVARSLFREPRAAERLHELVYTLAREHGQAWVIATHNETLAQIADKRTRLLHGRLVPETGQADDPDVAP